MFLSDVGFEPTPSSEDQNSPPVPYKGTKLCLESGALDHSANLTVLKTTLALKKNSITFEPCQARTGDLLRVKQT